MDAARALADLTEISSEIEAAVLLDESGAVVASTPDDAERAGRIAVGARRLLERAREVGGRDGEEPRRLEAGTGAGSVFVVRREGRTLVATTGRTPTAGLVFYDLERCLKSLEEAPKPKPKRRRAPKKQADGAA